MKIIQALFMIFVFTSGGFSIAHATLIQEIDSSQIIGDDGFNLTFDTATNLRWLDLTAADGRSYNDVELNFASGGDFEGYRHATRAEVLNLWVNAGINHTLNFVNSPVNRDAILALMDMIGLTFQGSDEIFGDRRIALGWFDDTIERPTASSPSRAGFEQFFPTDPEWVTFFQCTDCVGSRVFESTIFNFDSTQGATGHWLVADSVSVTEPSIIALLAAGLFGIGLARHRQS